MIDGKRRKREASSLPYLRHWLFAAAMLFAVTLVTPVLAGLI